MPPNQHGFIVSTAALRHALQLRAQRTKVITFHLKQLTKAAVCQGHQPRDHHTQACRCPTVGVAGWRTARRVAATTPPQAYTSLSP